MAGREFRMPQRGEHVLLIVNPCAGRGRGESYANAIEARLRESGTAVLRCETTEAESGAGYASSAGERCARIVCIGGDGTLNAVINGMLGSGRKLPVTYIPAGTTNDFAQTLRIPKRVSQMRTALTDGRDVDIDAGQFDSRYFSYVASFGAFTKCSYETPRNRKRLFGHLAYVLEGMKDITALESRHIRVETKERVYEGEYAFGAFSNTVSIGGMLHYDSGMVDMNDGKLEMLLIRKPETLPEVHRLIHAIQSGTFTDPLFDFAASEEFRLLSDTGFSWSVDGERAESGRETVIRCLKSAVRITVPERKSVDFS